MKRTTSLHFAAFALVMSGAAQGAESLTLSQAMSSALAASPLIGREAAELRKQELEKDIARGQRLPKADLNGSYTRYAYPSLVTPIRQAGIFPPLDREIGMLGVALSLPLYAGGKLVAGESLAEHNREAATQQLRAAGQDLMFNVAATYTKALHLRDLQRALALRIRALEQEQGHVSQRLGQGRAARLELIRMQTQLSQARHDLLAVEQAERDALSLLAVLLGRSERLPPLADLAPVPLPLPATPEEALAKARRQRPDILQAGAMNRAASEKVNIARGERRPQVNLIARAQESAGSDWKGYDDWQIGVQISVPLFDGAIRRNRVDQADLERRKSDLQLEESGNRLAAEVEQAFGGVAEARSRLEVSAQGQVEADEAWRIETLRYESGDSMITDLLGAETARWSATVSRLQAGYDVITSQARLLRAIGELSAESFK